MKYWGTEQKGTYGYYKKKRIYVLVFTILLFTLSIGIYFFGRYHLGTIQSLYTVLAVLGMLPASKSAVNTIMHFRARECDLEAYTAMNKVEIKGILLYSLYITMYKGTVTIDCMYLDGDHIILYPCNHKQGRIETKVIEDYIKNILSLHHLDKVSVKVIPELEQYKKRIEQLQGRVDEQRESMDRMAQLMKQIAL